MEQRVQARTAELSRALAVVEAQKRELETALRTRNEIQQQLKTELEDARLLHSISAMLVDEDNVGELYQKLVDVGTLIMRSDFGSMQRFDPERGQLQLIAQSGLDEEAVAFWQRVHPGRATTCGHALARSARVVVDDFEACDFIAGTADAVAFRNAGVQSAQSTPLLTRDGRLVGMLTTHWTRKHQPQERDLRLLDIVARQAADLIERVTSAEALRQQAGRLVEVDRYKDEFLATLAHELRNPLAPIRTGLAVLKLRPEQAPRVMSMMERQLGHMVRLIDDLLEVSRISRGMVTLKRSRTTLGAVIDSAVETSRPLINAADHRFTLTVPGNTVWLDVDVTRVAQIVSNLLNNAEAMLAAIPAGGAAGRDAAQGRPARILVVDDNVDAAETLGLLLEELGHVTDVVTEAPKALAAALAFSPDVVFLDLGMPHLNGFDLARQMRAHPALGNVRLVALSGWGTNDDRAKSRDAGMDRHFTKPVLLDEVETMLGGWQAVAAK